MGMDALTASAFTALARTQLPDLHKKLAALAKLPVSKREADSELAQALSAVRSSLVRLTEWIDSQGIGSTPDRLNRSGIRQEQSPRKQISDANAEDQSKLSIAIEEGKLDSLTSLAAELVIDRARFTSMEEDIRSTIPHKIRNTFTEAVQQLDRHTVELRDTIMKIRMVPISHAFSRLPALVRDLSAQVGKEVAIDFAGENTEVDKTIVEQIEDPLIRIIQSCCRQGIETPDIRTKLGKSPLGQIKISARQEGNYILIDIKDDGQSNRAVEMDIVQSQVSKIKGTVDINTEQPIGMTIGIKLPLTLAIAQSLLVESAGEIFAIPMSSVIESKRINPEEIQAEGHTNFIKHFDSKIPVIYLHEAFKIEAKNEISWYSKKQNSQKHNRLNDMRLARREDRLYVVIVGSGDQSFGIITDQILHQQEIVIKSLGPILNTLPCIAGGFISGNAEVILVLDLDQIESRFISPARRRAA